MSSESDTQHDWEINPDKYLTDESGSFILKKDGTPRKKAGRAKGSKGRGYTYSIQTKKRMQAERSVRDKQRRVASVEAKLKGQRKALNNSKELLKEYSKRFSKDNQRISKVFFILGKVGND